MDVCLVIKQRLEELGLEQRDLAAAAEVTESYISQLLTRKKLPPEPSRTDIYDKMGKFLKLPSGKLIVPSRPDSSIVRLRQTTPNRTGKQEVIPKVRLADRSSRSLPLHDWK